jgi:uncharacterized BrkB/YihY/UPF0761 family membrane protein
MFGNKYGKISCATFTVNSLTADADAVLFFYFFFYFFFFIFYRRTPNKKRNYKRQTKRGSSPLEVEEKREGIEEMGMLSK